MPNNQQLRCPGEGTPCSPASFSEPVSRAELVLATPPALFVPPGETSSPPPPQVRSSVRLMT